MYDFTKLRFLVVEEYSLWRHLRRHTTLHMLKKIGVGEVNEVSRYYDALARLGASKYDIVLINVEMPNMSGFELMRTIRNYGARRDILIVAMGFGGSAQDIVRATQSEATYLLLPLRENYLRARMQAILRAPAVQND